MEKIALLREIASKYYGDFYCFNCLHSLRTKNKLESHEKLCENKYFCNVVMPSEDSKILELSQYHKSNKTLFTIYAYLESLKEKIDGCKNNSDKSFTTKVGKYIPSGFSMSTILSFKDLEKKHDVYRVWQYL